MENSKKNPIILTQNDMELRGFIRAKRGLDRFSAQYLEKKLKECYGPDIAVAVICNKHIYIHTTKPIYTDLIKNQFAAFCGINNMPTRGRLSDNAALIYFPIAGNKKAIDIQRNNALLKTEMFIGFLKSVIKDPKKKEKITLYIYDTAEKRLLHPTIQQLRDEEIFPEVTIKEDTINAKDVVDDNAFLMILSRAKEQEMINIIREIGSSIVPDLVGASDDKWEEILTRLKEEKEAKKTVPNVIYFERKEERDSLLPKRHKKYSERYSDNVGDKPTKCCCRIM